MHEFLKFIFGIELCMFRTCFMSIIRSLLLYKQQEVYVIEDGLHSDPASKQSAKSLWHIPLAVYTVLDSWWRTENLSEICRVLVQKWIWEINAYRWFCYKKTSIFCRFTVHTVDYLITHTATHACIYIYIYIYIYISRSPKFTVKRLKRSYAFRSRDHPQGAYICSLGMIVWSKHVGAF